MLFKQAEVTLDPEDDEKNDEDVEDEDEEIGGGELSQEQASGTLWERLTTIK